MSELTLIILLSGIGTFLLRFLPIWQTRRKPKASSRSGRLQGFLQGIGPAAMTALLTVSLWPMLKGTENSGQGLIVCAALAVIFITKRLFSGIALPTLIGALTYGILMHFLS